MSMHFTFFLSIWGFLQSGFVHHILRGVDKKEKTKQHKLHPVSTVTVSRELEPAPGPQSKIKNGQKKQIEEHERRKVANKEKAVATEATKRVADGHKNSCRGRKKGYEAAEVEKKENPQYFKNEVAAEEKKGGGRKLQPMRRRCKKRKRRLHSARSFKRENRHRIVLQAQNPTWSRVQSGCENWFSGGWFL